MGKNKHNKKEILLELSTKISYFATHAGATEKDFECKKKSLLKKRLSKRQTSTRLKRSDVKKKGILALSLSIISLVLGLSVLWYASSKYLLKDRGTNTFNPVSSTITVREDEILHTDLDTTHRTATTLQRSSLLEEYKEINKDVVAVLSIPSLEIEYPVFQKKHSNSYYLDKDFNRKPNPAGSLFLDGFNSSTFKDDLNIIYGHERKDGIMFGNLKRYLDEKSGVDKEIILYTFDDARVYEVVSVTVENMPELTNLARHSDFTLKNLVLTSVEKNKATWFKNVQGYSSNARYLQLATCYTGGQQLCVLAKELDKIVF